MNWYHPTLDDTGNNLLSSEAFNMQENYMYLHIFKKVETTGCVAEDGGDTRKSQTSFIVVPDTKWDDFQEAMADVCGYQDYSYQVECKEIAKVGHSEINDLVDELKKWMNR